MKSSLGISNFLEEIPSLSHSIVFLYFFALITEEGFLISLLFLGTLHSNGYIFPLLLCLSLLFFSQLLVRPPQTTILCFCISFLGNGLDHFIRYDLNQIHYDYTVEVTNRFKGLGLIDIVPEELWTEVHDTVQETVIETILTTLIRPN